MHKVEFLPKEEAYRSLTGFSLDVLEFRAAPGPTALHVAGWIGQKGRMIRALCFHSGFMTVRIAVDVPREDVIKALPDAGIAIGCGFDGRLSVDGMGEDFSFVVTAVLEADTHSGETIIWLGEIVGRQMPFRDSRLADERRAAGGPAPLCLTCLGRTGSTVAMRLLRAHPAIVVAGDHPYEVKYAQKSFSGLLQALERSMTEAAACLDGEEAHARFRTLVRRDMTDATAGVIRHFYESVGQAQGRDRVKYFAEKCLPSFLPNVARDVYGPSAKEIILVRDPRDIFSSARRFNDKRGFLDFGSEHYAAASDWFGAIRHAFVQLAACHARRPQSLVVRYEDLILDAQGTIPKILAYLGLPSGEGVIAAMEHALSERDQASLDHMTSPSSRQSIGRWCADEDRDLLHAGEEDYLKAMRTFGYL